jgi:hypothetical protein
VVHSKIKLAKQSRASANQGMKAKTLRRAAPAVAIIGTALIVSCAERVFVTGSNSPTLEVSAAAKTIIFDQAGIYIPGVALSEQEHSAMDRVLARYDKLLYRIETYRNGELVKSVGALPDRFIVEADKIRRNARSRRLNGTALQVGFIQGSRHGSPTPEPAGSGRGVGTRHVEASPTPTYPQATPPGGGVGSRHESPTGSPGTGTGSRHESPEATPGTGTGSRKQIGRPVGVSEKDRGEAEQLVSRLKAILQK